MTYTVYYLIYGVKLSPEFIKSLCKYFRDIEGYNNIDDDITNHFPMIHEIYDGDLYIGMELWSTNDCNWNDYNPAKCLPDAYVSDEDRLKCQKSIQSFLDLLPESFHNHVNLTSNFYWCSGSN